jgi:formylglycine-generating enzyme required for sulfatase activity
MVMGNNPSCFKGKHRPVEQVSRDDCQAFCARLRERIGWRFRLPPEAEWEYACRAGTTTPFFFGDTIHTDQANYDGNYPYGKGKKRRFREKTTSVGSFPANAWGLFDLHGNVWEWCEDGHGLHKRDHIQDPQNGINASVRVLRGGSWGNNACVCRAACRSMHMPEFRNFSIGFRVTFRLD